MDCYLNARWGFHTRIWYKSVIYKTSFMITSGDLLVRISNLKTIQTPALISKIGSMVLVQFLLFCVNVIVSLLCIGGWEVFASFLSYVKQPVVTGLPLLELQIQKCIEELWRFIGWLKRIKTTRCDVLIRQQATSLLVTEEECFHMAHACLKGEQHLHKLNVSGKTP